MDDVEVDAEDNEELQKLLGTTSFGKQVRISNTRKQLEASARPVAQNSGDNAQPSRDKTNGSSKKSKAKIDSDDSDDDSEDDDDDDDDSDDDADEFPVTHEMVIKTHDRAVTTVTLDPSGGRLVSGGMDCVLKFHDFSSMTPTTIRAFKSIDPTATKTSTNVEVHPVHQALFNPLSASHLLVVTALPRARIMSRDGDTIAEFAKGDMYLRDMHNTKGHISEVTAGSWHPTDRNVCVTAGTDSTLRIWDVNNPRTQREVIVHKSRAAGSAGRSRMTAIAWGSTLQGGSNVLVSAALDGTLAMWSGDGPFTRPSAEIRDAHIADTWTSGLDISADGRLVITRGGDNLIKLWDTRKFKHPVNTVEHVSTSQKFPSSSICFSPGSSFVLTGSETGHLHILNPATLRPELVTPVSPGSPLVTAVWHAKLNQIITGSANGETHVLYSPEKSIGGAKDVMLRAPKKRHVDDDPNLTMDLSQGISENAIIVPGGGIQGKTSFASRHPTVGLTASGRSRDPRRPHQPQQTPFAKSNPDAEYVRSQIPLSSLRDEDPREALLKYADKAKNDPMFTNAWKDTQPQTIYAELSSDEEDGPDKKKARH